MTVNKTIYHESEMHNENHIQPKKWQWDKSNRKMNVFKVIRSRQKHTHVMAPKTQ